MPILVFVVIKLVLFQVILFARRVHARRSGGRSCSCCSRDLFGKGCSANTTHPPPISLPPMALKRSWISTGQFRARNIDIAFGLILPCSSGAEGSVERGGRPHADLVKTMQIVIFCVFCCKRKAGIICKFVLLQNEKFSIYFSRTWAHFL